MSCRAKELIRRLGISYGGRTRVYTVKGWYPRPLDEGDKSPKAGRHLFKEAIRKAFGLEE